MKDIKRTLKKILGVVLIVVGVAGLFLPLLQGIVLIILGLVLLEDKKIRKFMEKYLKKIKRKGKTKKRRR